MNPNSVLFVGIKGKVTAINKRDGVILWTTKLSGGLGDDFVTLTCDDTMLYAAARGEIHCLDITTGNVLWINRLKGYGIGVASLCLYGFPPAPDPAAYERILAAKRSDSDAAAGS
ncbi:MAG: PQQ-binding-like beta-propeller repeat protein [Chthoniobacteraceae bacterium]